MDVILRATVVFFLLFGLFKAIGRRELSEMTAFDLVIAVVLGDLVQQGVTQEDFSLTGAALAAGTIATWALVLSLATFHSRKATAVLDGEPLLVMHDGTMIDEVMRLNRLTPQLLREAAREQGIGDLADVKAAVLEGDGHVSFIRRGDG